VKGRERKVQREKRKYSGRKESTAREGEGMENGGMGE
jgi:hypothetical protein